MPNTSDQKQKLLHIQKMLYKYTDEKHPMKADEIVERLEEYGITAERKSVYRDINVLREFGLDIEKSGGINGGFYLADRTFDMAELKLLADAVSSSKFITEKKSRELLKKLESLVSENEGSQLQRQVVVADRAKTDYEGIFYSVDAIYNAISNDHMLKFKYTDWTIKKTRMERHDGEIYLVSPQFLVWNNEYYYLVAYDEKKKAIKHYRVDKMTEVTETDRLRGGRTERGRLKAADYSKKTFSMFDGEDKMVSLRCENRLLGVIFDRFGTDITVRPDGDGHFIARTPVKVSPQFYGWLTGLGAGARLAAPQEEVQKYAEYLATICRNYSQPEEE